MRIKKDLEKTVPKNDVKKALELLRYLESVPMTLDVLQKTHIGASVNKIRKSIDNSEVSSLSKGMVKKWKKLLASTSQASSTSSNKDINSSTNSPLAANITSSGGDSKTNNSSVSSNESNANRIPSGGTNYSTDSSQQQQSISSTNNEKAKQRSAPVQQEVPTTTSDVRLKCRSLIMEALKKPLPKELAKESFLDEETLAARIEDHIYQEFKTTDMKYKNRVRSRVANLGDVKNPYLRLNVLRGDISPDRIAKMTADEMASDELKKEREKFTKEAINDHQMSLTSGTKTSEIKCPACKKFNVTYNQVQTRSADEPMTTFCYCNECGKRWKFC